ncbi:LysM peptidoglycan-binding domain-containing protein [Myxococcota bacterium]|nr:LysM peptidoglycan-binding domain-containing protein [Myxococcota bacterium]MBU1382534.1 LysM peptidoglycan-binding domain-containing protein [Myxococcota bacterium]MBU1497426.1 LysM peptidoglycan-binding domain-containing protein [Myxococcota bacterium]
MLNFIPLFIVFITSQVTDTPFIPNNETRQRLKPQSHGRIWVRGKPVKEVIVADSVISIQIMEEIVFPDKKPVVKIEKATVPVPSEISWMKGYKSPDIPVKFDQAVIQYLNYFRNTRGGRATIKNWIEQSYRYRQMILSELKKNSLPSAILYIAMIESGFEIKTKSYAGAAGLWQFMKSGADIYGLRVNRWIDQRYSPELSTIAVMDYFRDLYFRFGNWHTALAAYNCGYGRMLQTMRRYSTDNYWKMLTYENALPRETRLYIPKLIAVALADLNREKFNLGKINPAPAYNFSEVSVPGGISFSRISSITGVPLKEITELNKDFLKNYTPPGEKLVYVRVPMKNGKTAQAALRKYRGFTPVRTYTVEFGDDLKYISQSYGVSATSIKKLNELGLNEKLRPGTVLLLPASALAQKKKVDLPEDIIVNVPREILVPRGFKRYFYKTTDGDTLKVVSKNIGVSIEKLLSWNYYEEDSQLVNGLYIQVFLNEKAKIHPKLISESSIKLTYIDSTEFHDHYLNKYKKVRVVYRIRRGDTLKSIAKKFKTNVRHLRTVNHSNLKEIKPGQDLIVYTPPHYSKYYKSKQLKNPVNRNERGKEATKTDKVNKVPDNRKRASSPPPEKKSSLKKKIIKRKTAVVAIKVKPNHVSSRKPEKSQEWNSVFTSTHGKTWEGTENKD